MLGGGSAFRCCVVPLFPREFSVGATSPNHIEWTLGVFDKRHHVFRPADDTMAASYLATPKRHRELCPCGISRSRITGTRPRRVPPTNGKLIGVSLAPAADTCRVARCAVPSAGARSFATAFCAAISVQWPRRRKLIDLVDRCKSHDRRFGAKLIASLSHTLTGTLCLRRITSQARKDSRFSSEEEGVKAQINAQGGVDDRTTFAPPDTALSAIAREDARILAELARAVEDDLARPDLAASTERAYAHDWADFATFCRRHGLEALPAAPQTLALYLKSLETKKSQSPAGLRTGTEGLSVSTLRRRLAAIASKHATEKLETPTDHPLVKKLVRRYSRSRGTAEKKKDALTIERFPAILMAMPDDLPALRDRALLLLGYAGAFRRSELVALDVGDLRFSSAGLYVWIAAAKNDPRKKGRELYVPRLSGTELCAIKALESWIGIVGATAAVFRSFNLRGRLTANRLDPGDVARILRRRCIAAGVDGDFAGHSLRRGFITNAAKKKIPIESIKRVTGQRSSGIVLNYVAAAILDDDPPFLEIVG